LFLPLPVPRGACGTRHDGVSGVRLHWVIGDNDGIHRARAKSRVAWLTTVAWFAWINTNSKFRFDDGCSRRLEQY